jgi:hypothetical protein
MTAFTLMIHQVDRIFEQFQVKGVGVGFFLALYRINL